MRVLSIDPATKSLAVSILDFNKEWRNDLGQIREAKQVTFHAESDLLARINILAEWVSAMDKILDTIVTLRYVNVFDLLPGEKVVDGLAENRMARLKGVSEYLRFINDKIGGPIDTVLIEYQMSLNDKSRGIASALAYEFSQASREFAFHGSKLDFKREFDSQSSGRPCRVEIVGPALKGKVYFGSAGHIQNFRRKYMGNYTSNKAHAKYNFLKWISDHQCEQIIEGIPRGNLDDVADSFLMAYAWCIKNSKN